MRAMNMKINTLISLQYIPYLLAFGAVILFALGYVSHMMLGANNAVEQISEELLNKEYKIRVEFSDEGKQ
jgi:flagellar biosynthesis protein FliQ